ncbi:unnamed protein product [Citrullus colocynthis]|uniref:Uncharacterized protein n=1 Tax=Citrullus colocynthis TaxID=252529 RepID=A0ABP0Y934_9ROSI
MAVPSSLFATQLLSASSFDEKWKEGEGALYEYHQVHVSNSSSITPNFVLDSSSISVLMHFLSISSLAATVAINHAKFRPSIDLYEFRVSVLCFTMEGSVAEDIEGPESWKVAALDEAVRQLNSKSLEHFVVGAALSDRSIAGEMSEDSITQYPLQKFGMPFIHRHEQVHQPLSDCKLNRQAEVSSPSFAACGVEKFIEIQACIRPEKYVQVFNEGIFALNRYYFSLHLPKERWK